MVRRSDKENPEQGKLIDRPSRFTLKNEPEFQRLVKLLEEGKIDEDRLKKYMEDLAHDENESE